MTRNGGRATLGARSWGNALALLGALGAGCGDGVGPICEKCVAGGQTSDFGSVDPCAIDYALTPVDPSEARELGYEGFEALDRDFSLPMVWLPQSPGDGTPATGYDVLTVVNGRSRVASLAIGHPDPNLPKERKCEDTLKVTLNVELATADESLKITGQMTTRVHRGFVPFSAEANLPLSAAQGTLQLHPSSWSWVHYGGVYLDLYFFEERVRGRLAIYLADEAGGDGVVPDRSYLPLTARFPLDVYDADCFPIATDEATSVGPSLLEMRDEMQAVVGTEPVPGVWSDGSESSVVTTFGDPTHACVRYGRVAFQVPFGITSDDDRIRFNQVANAGGGYPNGSLWFSVENYETRCVPHGVFETRTGISGVDFRGLPEACWDAYIQLKPPVMGDSPEPPPVPRGALVINGFGREGSVEFARFEWPK